MNKNTELFLEASSFGDEARILELLRNTDIDINASDAYMMTALHYAVIHQQIRVVHELLSRPDINVNIQNHECCTPLLLAAKSLNKDITDALLNMPHVDLFVQDVKHNTPLDIAILNDDSYLVERYCQMSNATSEQDHFFLNSSLYKAANLGKVNFIDALLNIQDMEVYIDFKYTNPLTIAAERGRLDCMRSFMQYFVTHVDYPDGTLLQYLLSDDVDSFSSFVEAGNFDFERDVVHLWTPIHLAVLLNSIKIADLLLSKYHVNANTTDDFDSTPLHHAAAAGLIEMSKLLITKAGVNVNVVNGRGFTPLFFAAQNGHVEYIKYLLSTTDINVDFEPTWNFTPLLLAAENNHIECLKLLLASLQNSSGFSNKGIYYALEKSIICGHQESLHLLLNHYSAHLHAEDNSGKTLLHTAAEFNPGIFQYLLKTQEFPLYERDYHGQLLLHHAARSTQSTNLKYLLSIPQFRMCVNAQDHHGFTPLHSSAVLCRMENVKLLINDAHALVNIQNRKGETPLHRAFTSFNLCSSLRLLLKSPSMLVNMEDENGNTLLHLAIMNEYDNKVEDLLQREDIDVNVPNNEGKTPLHYAVLNYKYHSSTAKILLKNQNIIFNIKDNEKKTPLAYAQELTCANKDEIINLLMARGATL